MNKKDSIAVLKKDDIVLPPWLIKGNNKRVNSEKGWIRCKKAMDQYENLFGTPNDLHEYLSTWYYCDNDWNELAEKIENCVKKRKKYKKLYMTLIERIYYKTIYKFVIKFIDE